MSLPNTGPSGQPSMDLDQFLNANQAQAAPQMALTKALPDPQADRMLVAIFLADDSGSMSHLRDAVVQGLDVGVKTLAGIKGSDCYLIVGSFHSISYEGPLSALPERCFETYSTAGGTPLISRAVSLYSQGQAVAEKYRSQGIHTTLAGLIFTDGAPDDSEWTHAPQFRSLIGAQDYVVGMGIAPDERTQQTFVDCFQKMGITRIMTPKDSPTAVRRAINQFSQSVASIAA